ncbi:hypothetical protein B0A49_08295 [Cryomyces minteri]|uniref:Secreted protein n=1 Tax=Cryomyces minteri TaxID=331657 RepID=A0A4U0WXG6_9PEZI|nr:hypothetical protein B0A49_08295 [Cryomyces minteri]
MSVRLVFLPPLLGQLRPAFASADCVVSPTTATTRTEDEDDEDGHDGYDNDKSNAGEQLARYRAPSPTTTLRAHAARDDYYQVV